MRTPRKKAPAQYFPKSHPAALLLWFVLLFPHANGQNRFPPNYFTAPIDTPLRLSGGFAELRNNHLHGGLDFRTGGEEGWPIYAAADGFVGRIRVSGQGYGNCLYLVHPNGYTTVYGHLSDFAEPIRSWVRNRHYQSRENELDVHPKADELPVKKDQLVAYGGNTGASSGPHLHFEIRHTETEELINPQWFGLHVDDDVRPTFDALEFVPLGKNSRVQGQTSDYRMKLRQDSAGFWRAAHDLAVDGTCYVQVKVWDKHTDNELRQGIYRLLLVAGNDTLYEFRADRYAQSETRYANTVLDYEAKMLDNETLYRLFRAPGNHLRLVNSEVGNGTLTPPALGKTTYTLYASDFYGNTSTCSFAIGVGTTPTPARGMESTRHAERYEVWVPPGKALNIERPDLRLRIPSGTFYDTLKSHITVKPGPGASCSPAFTIGSARIPVHQHFTLAIRSQPLPPGLKHRVVALSPNIKGVVVAHAGRWKGDWFETKVRQLGSFYLAADTVAPTIVPQFNSKRDTLTAGQNLRFTLRDALSGIRSFHLYVGEYWNLLTWDAKSATLSAIIDENAPKGNQNLCLIVHDVAGNEATYSIPIYIP